MTYYGSSFAKGLAGEQIVRAALDNMGIVSVDSTKYENIMQDIDCWIYVARQLEDIGVSEGIYPLSIKRQDSGIKYKNIGFELYQQESAKENETRTEEERWTKTGWYHTGVCPIYAILQGNIMRLMTKCAVEDTFNKQGWLRKRPLTAALRNAISKTARYSDAICGYLYQTDVHHLAINVNDQSKTIIRPGAPQTMGKTA